MKYFRSENLREKEWSAFNCYIIQIKLQNTLTALMKNTKRCFQGACWRMAGTELGV